MHPILIIQTPYVTVIYIQGQKYLQNTWIPPLTWMKIGEIGARLGIQDYSIHVKKLYICENEVNVGIDLRHFPDKVEQLHQEIINLLNGAVNMVRVDDINVSSENVVENIGVNINKNNRRCIVLRKRRNRTRKYTSTIKRLK